MRGHLLVLAAAAALAMALPGPELPEGPEESVESMLDDKVVDTRTAQFSNLERGAAFGHTKVAAGSQNSPHKEQPPHKKHFNEHHEAPFSYLGLHVPHENPHESFHHQNHHAQGHHHQTQHHQSSSFEHGYPNRHPHTPPPYLEPYQEEHYSKDRYQADPIKEERFKDYPYKDDPYTGDELLHDLVSLDELKIVLREILDEYFHKNPKYDHGHKPRPKAPTSHDSVQQWSKCTCKSPAEFSADGRGNCNVGAIKSETKVWCYVENKYGDPAHICPDATPSNSKKGYYWSRYACIT